ncbi:hypothetical protein BMETH_780_1 [methanotrophic bacterial endosymbiont of Bathymodiolus sp.]|nr:hypothetical protein BMETH_780_1 [methanotrophic bacterial endosymbiont of Bathymodiolus sp.]
MTGFLPSCRNDELKKLRPSYQVNFRETSNHKCISIYLIIVYWVLPAQNHNNPPLYIVKRHH